MQKGKLQLKKYKFDLFMKKFKAGECGLKGLGQAFYDHFNLAMLADQTQLKNVCEKDGEQALKTIKDIFKFN